MIEKISILIAMIIIHELVNFAYTYTDIHVRIRDELYEKFISHIYAIMWSICVMTPAVVYLVCYNDVNLIQIIIPFVFSWLYYKSLYYRIIHDITIKKSTVRFNKLLSIYMVFGVWWILMMC